MYLKRKPISIRKLAVWLLFLYPFYQGVLQDKLGISFVSFLDEILILFLVISFFLNKKKIMRWEKIFLSILLAWGMWGCISSVLRGVSIGITLSGMILQLKNYLIVVIVAGIRWTRFDILRILKALKHIYFVVIILGFVFYFFPSVALFKNIYMTSVFNGEPLFATMMVPVGIYAFVMYIQKREKKQLALLGIVFVCLILATTIKNIISLLLACAFYFTTQKGNRRRKMNFIMLGMLGLVAFSPYIISIFSIEIEGNFLVPEAINRPRWMLYRYGFKIAKDFFPFGSGFGTYATSISYTKHYSDIYGLYGIDTRYGFQKGDVLFLQDSYWPAVMGETGFIGVIFAVTLLGIITIQLRRAIKYAPFGDREIVSVVLYSWIALLIESCFTSTFFGARSYMILVFSGIVIKYVAYSSCLSLLCHETKRLIHENTSFTCRNN